MRPQPTTTQAASNLPDRNLGWLPGSLIFLTLATFNLAAAVATNAPSISPAPVAVAPDIGASLVRMAGALMLVIALFLGGVWLLRNWHRLSGGRGRVARLNVIEVKPLGHRQALMVVGYEQQRMLLATSATGVSLVTHLPEASSAEAASEVPNPAANFVDVLQHLVNRKA